MRSHRNENEEDTIAILQYFPQNVKPTPYSVWPINMESYPQEWRRRTPLSSNCRSWRGSLGCFEASCFSQSMSLSLSQSRNTWLVDKKSKWHKIWIWTNCEYVSYSEPKILNFSVFTWKLYDTSKNVLIASTFILHIFCVVKHLLKKNVQIIVLKHCFVQDDGGLANECTECIFLGGRH